MSIANFFDTPPPHVTKRLEGNRSVTPPFEWRSPREILARIADLLIACGVLGLCCPLLGLVALAIKLDSPGPVFCRYRRSGRDGRQITVLRFRASEHYARPGQRSCCWEIPLTRVGRFLRYTRIDRLPQLVNVLRGDLTVIRGGREQPM